MRDHEDIEKNPTSVPAPQTPASFNTSDGTGSVQDNEDGSRTWQGGSHIPVPVTGSTPPNLAQVTSVIEIPDEVYDRFPRHRKKIIVAVLSYLTFLAPTSSTTVLAAVPEVAAEYNTSGSVINLTNSMYLVAMAVSPLFWGPFSQVYGRRPMNLACAVLFLACSIGTAASPSLTWFFIFRVLTALESMAFILVGNACLGDMYRPTERATAMGYLLIGTLLGPCIGPVVGGLIVTYRSWRVIFWLQAGLAGVACVLVFFFCPETIHRKKIDDLEGHSGSDKAKVLWAMVNPWRVVRLFQYPNLTLMSLASSALMWNMYSLLTPIRYVLNPRFDLDSPAEGGLFYLAPGIGYMAGTWAGGRYADYMTNKWIRKRDGERVPEDRLRSSLPFIGLVIPACMLLYGWGVEKEFGGVALLVVVMFVQGVAQLFYFPSANTYCLDVMQGHGAEVISGNFLMRYVVSAGATAAVLPIIESIGIGWFSTITAGLLLVATAATMATIRWGKTWRDGIDTKRRADRMAAAMEKNGNTITTNTHTLQQAN